MISIFRRLTDGLRSRRILTLLAALTFSLLPMTTQGSACACDGRYKPPETGYIRITNEHSGKVLDVADGSTADGARVIQYRIGVTQLTGSEPAPSESGWSRTGRVGGLNG